MRTGIGNSHCRFHLGSTMSRRFPICHREVTTFPTSQNNSRAKFYAAGDLRVTRGLKDKRERSPLLLCHTALEPGALLWIRELIQRSQRSKPRLREELSAGCCRNPQGFPSLHLRVMPGEGQSGTVSLKKRRDYGRGIFSLETGRLTGPETGILLLVKTKSRSNWLSSATTTPRAQSLPPHTLLSSKFLLLNPTGDRILSQPCRALPSQAVPTATPGSEL